MVIFAHSLCDGDFVLRVSIATTGRSSAIFRNSYIRAALHFKPLNGSFRDAGATLPPLLE